MNVGASVTMKTPCQHEHAGVCFHNPCVMSRRVLHPVKDHRVKDNPVTVWRILQDGTIAIVNGLGHLRLVREEELRAV